MKGSLDTIIKLLSYDLQVTGLSHGNSLLQRRVRLHTIYLSLRLCIGRSFVHRTAFYRRD